MKKVMFVCTGNTCRSAMAAAYMQYLVKTKQKQDDYLISSCGVSAVTGTSATLNSIYVMKKYGVDMVKHRSTYIEDINIKDYDYIFCMTSSQKLAVSSLYPSLINKTYTLKEYVLHDNKNLDIVDPYGSDIEKYEMIANEIMSCIDKLLKLI